MAAPQVYSYVLRKMLAEFQRRKLELCAGADKVYVKLKNAGALVPPTAKWNSLSCDQKLLFMAALGPLGIEMAIAGVLLGGFATNAAAEMSKHLGPAASAIGDTASNWATSAGNTVTNIVKRIF